MTDFLTPRYEAARTKVFELNRIVELSRDLLGEAESALDKAQTELSEAKSEMEDFKDKNRRLEAKLDRGYYQHGQYRGTKD